MRESEPIVVEVNESVVHVPLETIVRIVEDHGSTVRVALEVRNDANHPVIESATATVFNESDELLLVVDLLLVDDSISSIFDAVDTARDALTTLQMELGDEVEWHAAPSGARHFELKRK